MLLSGSKHESDALQNIVHTGNGDTVAQRLVPCRVRGAGDVRPAVREALEPFSQAFRQYNPATSIIRLVASLCCRALTTRGVFDVERQTYVPAIF